MGKGSVTHWRDTKTNNKDNVDICLNCTKGIDECNGEYCEEANPDLVGRQRKRQRGKYKPKGKKNG